MRKMRRSSVKVYRKLSDGPVLPQWVKVVPYALGALMFIFVSTSMFEKKTPQLTDADRINAQVDNFASRLNDQTLQSPPVDAGLAPPAPVSTPTETSVSPSTAPPQNPTSSVKVSLPYRNGGSTEVDEAALATARAATVALFTGNFSSLSMVPGVQPPSLPRTWNDPYVGDPTLIEISDATLAIGFRVDPDRDGPSPLREIVSRVEFVPGVGWAWGGV